MTRIAGLLFFLTAAGAALFLFQIKQEVREMEEELGIVHRDILRHQEAIRVLKTEWSYLNQPARIADLAGRHLDLRPLTARQFVRLEDLPPRGARPAPTPALALARAPAPHKDSPKDTALTEAGSAR
ncbi:MAG: hypothetical protein IID48_20155 [Proteobacteria bacterium]|nr:hypothetical protein [Pseudomonadota bacterium]